MTRDPRIDAYVDKAAPFARPILDKVRERVHAVVPDATETIKWGAPTFTKGGKILIVMAAFKAHAAVNFWNAKALGLEETEGMGSLGKLASVQDLPANFDSLLKDAAARTGTSAPRKTKAPPRPVGDLHSDFIAALDGRPEAKATFDAFAPSHKREYVEWVGEAKQDATRARRIAQAIEWLGEGKKRNWKYENC